MVIAKPDFRVLKKQGNADVLRVLADLTTRAESGEITAMAWVIETPDGVSQGHTSTDDAIKMLGAVGRLQYWFNRSLDGECS